MTSSPVSAAVAMSGGVDSSVAALLALRKGCRTIGVTMKHHKDMPEEDISDARTVCEMLGIRHVTVDLTEEFRRLVMNYFADSYIDGLTPNPCVYCNRVIKFGLLLDRVRKEGCDYIISGHYACIKKQSGRYVVMRATDRTKDQSYVLWSLSQEQLSHIQLPLGEMSKSQVRDIASESGFVSADRPDSQDICFIPHGDYGKFIRDFTGRSFEEGDFIGTDGKHLGKHKGYPFYTTGQRKGLGISSSAPLYVVRKSKDDNVIYLGSDSELFTKKLTARQVNLIALDKITAPLRVTAKTRYSQRECGAAVYMTGEDEITLEFDTPQRAITPGQSVVMYDGDVLIGGGIIKD